jgi:hypothetical protein
LRPKEGEEKLSKQSMKEEMKYDAVEEKYTRILEYTKIVLLQN